MSQTLTEAAKLDIALALLLLKDFKQGDRAIVDVDLFVQIHELAIHLDVHKQFDELISKVPHMRIEPRNP